MLVHDAHLSADTTCFFMNVDVTEFDVKETGSHLN